MPLVDSHCRLTLPTNSMYCDCALSFMFCRLYWLAIYFPAALEPWCKSSLSANILSFIHHHCFSLSILAVKFIKIHFASKFPIKILKDSLSLLFRVSQDVRLSNELGMAILQTPAGDLSLIYAVHITYVHKKHLNPHKGYRVVLNGSSKGSTKIAALNSKLRESLSILIGNLLAKCIFMNFTAKIDSEKQWWWIGCWLTDYSCMFKSSSCQSQLGMPWFAG